MKVFIAAVTLLALASPAHAITCTGRVKVDVATVSEGLRLKGDKIAYVDGCAFVNPAPILRKCPAGSRCRVEGGDEEDGGIEKVISVTRIDPYREGMRDYRRGQCFRARPYIDHGPEQKLWERGYDAGAKKYPKRDMSHCHAIEEKHLDNSLEECVQFIGKTEIADESAVESCQRIGAKAYVKEVRKKRP